MSGIFYLDNDHLLRGRGLYTIALTTGLPVYLDGTVTAQVTLLTAAGGEVPGVTWPVAFTYIAGSQGEFLAVLSKECVVTENEELTAHVTFNAGTNQYGDWRGRVIVQQRSF